jgi:hypothetical protein
MALRRPSGETGPSPFFTGGEAGYSYPMTPITDNAALAVFCQKLASAPFIAVDTEFMRFA